MTDQTFETSSRQEAVPIPSRTPIGVIGAGTMGSGIAQVAALAGHLVKIFDTRSSAIPQAIESVKASLCRGAARRTISDQDVLATVNRIVPVMVLEELSDTGLVIEAIAENLEIKQQVFQYLEKIVAPDCILATNTSSLSITELARVLDRPDRFVGMHFFNPAPIMELIEIVSGLATDSQVVATVAATASGAVCLGNQAGNNNNLRSTPESCDLLRRRPLSDFAVNQAKLLERKEAG
jgi:3-hydroxybutyryl-CoA dehydrogenase